MSGADLGQSWLMCPQLPRGFWSGGSNACTLTMNTNTEYYWILLPYSKWNGVIRITSRQLGWLSKFAYTKSDNPNSWLCPCASCCVNTVCEWLCLCWSYGCVRPVNRRWAVQGYLSINTQQPHNTFQMASQLLDCPFAQTAHDTQSSQKDEKDVCYLWNERHPCHCIYRQLCCY